MYIYIYIHSYLYYHSFHTLPFHTFSSAQNTDWDISHLQVTRVNGRRFQALGWTIKPQEERHGGNTTTSSWDLANVGYYLGSLLPWFRSCRDTPCIFQLEHQKSREHHRCRFLVNHQEHSKPQVWKYVQVVFGRLPSRCREKKSWQYHLRNLEFS